VPREQLLCEEDWLGEDGPWHVVERPQPGGPPHGGCHLGGTGRCAYAEAAQALSVSVPRYYALEQRAVAGLVAGCEPHLQGPAKSPQQRVAELEREVQRVRHQCDRQRALARAVQRTVGLPMPAGSVVTGKGRANCPTPPASGKKRRTRRPTVRALKAAQALRDTQAEEPTSESRVAEKVSATTNP
jgi:hypothetical protein